MQLKLVQSGEGYRPNTIYQQTKDDHREAVRLVEMAGMSALDGPDDSFNDRMQQRNILISNERKIRKLLVNAPVMTVEDIRDKAAYFRGLVQNEWIDIGQDDIAAVLLSFEKMSD